MRASSADENRQRTRMASRVGRRGRPVAALPLTLLAVLPVALLVAGPAASIEWPEGSREVADQAFDVVVLRPLALIRLVAGAGLFLPVTLLWPPEYRDNFEQFVEEPFDYAIIRPLGQDLAGR